MGNSWESFTPATELGGITLHSIIFIRKIYFGTILFCLVTGLVACSEEVNDSELEGDLNIGVYLIDDMNFPFFEQRYVTWFNFAHKAIDVEIVSKYEDYGSVHTYYADPLVDSVVGMKTWLHESPPPDIVVMKVEQYLELVDEGLFYPLDSLFAKSKLNIDDLASSVRDLLSHPTDRQLYGIAPTYSTDALVFNKEIFAETGVEEPWEGITWAELFVLSERIASESGSRSTYGFSFHPEYDGRWFDHMLQKYCYPQGMRMYDESAQMEVTTHPWQQTWSEMIRLMKLDGIPNWTLHGDTEASFYNGNIAMTLISFEHLQTMDMRLDESERMDWGVVSAPRFADGQQSGNATMDYVFAIHQHAENIDNAWFYLQTLLDRQWYEDYGGKQFPMLEKTRVGLAHSEVLSVFEDFRLNVHPHAAVDDSRALFFGRIKTVGRWLFENSLSDQLTVAEALAEWEAEGNKALAKAVEYSISGFRY